MGVSGRRTGEALALERVLRNIVKMFMDGKLAYKPIRTLTLGQDISLEGERLRTVRKDSQRLQPVTGPVAVLEEAEAR
ncbi:MAG: hypothetical protein O6952_07950 [Planctomycetota bacterium]|nr:hypothetical protein [Planctomycetota bacterium]